MNNCTIIRVRKPSAPEDSTADRHMLGSVSYHPSPFPGADTSVIVTLGAGKFSAAHHMTLPEARAFAQAIIDACDIA